MGGEGRDGLWTSKMVPKNGRACNAEDSIKSLKHVSVDSSGKRVEVERFSSEEDKRIEEEGERGGHGSLRIALTSFTRSEMLIRLNWIFILMKN